MTDSNGAQFTGFDAVFQALVIVLGMMIEELMYGVIDIAKIVPYVNALPVIKLK